MPGIFIPGIRTQDMRPLPRDALEHTSQRLLAEADGRGPEALARQAMS